MYRDLAFALPLMQVPRVASCTSYLVSSWVYFGLLAVARGLFIASHDAHIQSISMYSLPRQMVSAFHAFHVGQVLQNLISLGRNLWLASLCQSPFQKQSWKWLWTVCTICTPDAWTAVACWSLLDVWQVIRTISHAIKHVAARQHYLNQPGCLIWNLLKGVVPCWQSSSNEALSKSSSPAVCYCSCSCVQAQADTRLFCGLIQLIPWPHEHGEAVGRVRVERGWHGSFWWQPAGAVRVLASWETQGRSRVAAWERSGSKVWVFSFDVCICSPSSHDALISEILG